MGGTILVEILDKGIDVERRIKKLTLNLFVNFISSMGIR